MKSLAEFIIRVANLIEAEGRLAKRHAASLILAALMFLVAALMLLGMLLAIVAAVYLLLVKTLPAWSALLIIAGLFLVLALIILIVGHATLSKKQ